MLLLNVASCLFGIIATALCLVARRRLRDTTLAAPCTWAAASFAAATAALMWRCLSPAASTSAHIDYLAGITTVAPFVALLGAKRPQDRAWQWIVAALIGLLAFQDLRTWSVDPTTLPSLHAAWQWLLAGLIVVQWLNYLATRRAAAACLAFAGQGCLLSHNLPFLPEPSSWSFPVGMLLLSFAVLGAAMQARSRRMDDAWQAAWLDFRDMYGVLWSLRVAERVNALVREQYASKAEGKRQQAESLAGEQHTILRLTWHGIDHVESLEGSSPPLSELADAEPLQRALRSVLTRFVSANWLARRLGLES